MYRLYYCERVQSSKQQIKEKGSEYGASSSQTKEITYHSTKLLHRASWHLPSLSRCSPLRRLSISLRTLNGRERNPLLLLLWRSTNLMSVLAVFRRRIGNVVMNIVRSARRRLWLLPSHREVWRARWKNVEAMASLLRVGVVYKLSTLLVSSRVVYDGDTNMRQFGIERATARCLLLVRKMVVTAAITWASVQLSSRPSSFRLCLGWALYPVARFMKAFTALPSRPPQKHLLL